MSNKRKPQMNKSNKTATIKLTHEEISVAEVAVHADRNVAEFRRRHWTKVLSTPSGKYSFIVRVC